MIKIVNLIRKESLDAKIYEKNQFAIRYIIFITVYCYNCSILSLFSVFNLLLCLTRSTVSTKFLSVIYIFMTVYSYTCSILLLVTVIKFLLHIIKSARTNLLSSNSDREEKLYNEKLLHFVLF